MSLALSPFEKALESLNHVLSLPKDDIIRDSAIKRFEYTYELAWKMIQRWRKDNVSPEKADPLTRKDLFRLAAQNGLIKDPAPWFGYHEARNETSHAYNEAKAEKVYKAATLFAGEATSLLEELKRRND